MVRSRFVQAWFCAAFFVLVGGMLAGEGLSIQEEDQGFTFLSEGGELGEFVVGDEQILRPYFSNLRSLGGVLLTRSHPPEVGVDAEDHATMHPGVWVGFGDISGVDFWRNKGRMEFAGYVERPRVAGGRLSWVMEHRLRGGEGELGMMRSRCLVWLESGGWALSWEVIFRAGAGGLAFGDQEEMGFGVRVATPLVEKRGGRIRNSRGLETAKASWGQGADWCDYSAVVGGVRRGVLAMTDPANFRGSWWHNRNYGLMVANAFGREAMEQGEVSRVWLGAGEELRLRYGAFFYEEKGDGSVESERVYEGFLKAAR